MTLALVWQKQLVGITNNMERIDCSLCCYVWIIIVYNPLLLDSAVPVEPGPGRKTVFTPRTVNLKFSDLYRFSLCPQHNFSTNEGLTQTPMVCPLGTEQLNIFFSAY